MINSLRLYGIGLLLICLLGSGNQAFADLVGLQPGGGGTDVLDIGLGPFSVSTIGAAGGGERLSGLDFHPNTSVLYASSGGGGTNPGSLFTINVNTGAATFIGDTGFTKVPGLAFDSSGTLFGTATTGLAVDYTDRLITIDPDTGIGTDVGLFDGGIDGIDSLAVHPTTGILYGGGAAANYDNLITIDKMDGEATVLGVLTAAGTGAALPNPLVGLAFDPLGNFYGSLGDGDGRIIEIDIGALEFTILGDATVSGSVSDIAFATPEPSSFVLLGIGAVGIFVWRRRESNCGEAVNSCLPSSAPRTSVPLTFVE